MQNYFQLRAEGADGGLSSACTHAEAESAHVRPTTSEESVSQGHSDCFRTKDRTLRFFDCTVAIFSEEASTRARSNWKMIDTWTPFGRSRVAGYDADEADFWYSMDGGGLDGQSVHERLWRSLKHEDIYLKSSADGREAHAGIACWIAFTIASVHIRRLATARRWRCGAKAPPPHSPARRGHDG
jgi:hypothetical protein